MNCTKPDIFGRILSDVYVEKQNKEKILKNVAGV